MDYAGNASHLKAIRDNREKLRDYSTTAMLRGLPVVAGLLLLAFSGVVNILGIIFLFILFILIPSIFIATSLQCPSCKNSSFSFEGIKAYPFCHHCGERVFSDPDFETKLKQPQAAVEQQSVVKKAKHIEEKLPREQDLQTSAAKEQELSAPFSAAAVSANGGYVMDSTLQGQLVFRPTKMKYALMGFAFVSVGMITMIIRTSDSWGDAFSGRGGLLLLLLPFVILWALGSLLLLKTVVFDKITGMYSLKAGTEAKLSTIEAVQIVTLYTEGRQVGLRYVRGTTTYQLNLIFKDGSRKNILYGINIADLQHQGQTLANFLGVKLRNEV